MRPVNLLPARYRPARASGQRPNIGYFAIGALAVLLVMVLLLVVTNNQINDAKDKTAKAQAETQAAQVRIGQLQGYGNFAAIKAAREGAVMGVAESRFDYERLMREMALVMPHNSYLTTFTASPGGGATTTSTTGTTTSTGPTVTIGGCSPSHPDVATVVVRLRQLHNVSDVELNSSTKAAAAPAGTTGGVCKVAWNATLSFNAESPTTAQQPVPARLGGGQ